MNNIFGVVFKTNGKIYNFISDDKSLIVGDRVIVETEKGTQLGKIVCESSEDVDTSSMKQIIRKVTDADYSFYLDTIRLADEALIQAKEIVMELQIDMNLLNATYTFDRKQLLFNFIANERVDFRELVKRLASIFHTRIELRQIGVRDKAREISGIGQCGRKLCCSSFLDNIESITINMAKNQDIALNPSKISGACGRLLCCLTFEDDEYTRCKACMPSVGNFVQCEYGKGIVESVSILEGKYKVRINNDLYEIVSESCQCKGGK